MEPTAPVAVRRVWVYLSVVMAALSFLMSWMALTVATAPALTVQMNASISEPYLRFEDTLGGRILGDLSNGYGGLALRSFDFTNRNSVEMALGPDSTLRITVFKDGEPAAKWSLS